MHAYKWFSTQTQDMIQIVIVWDGEDLERLQDLDTENKIYFTGWCSASEAYNLQDQFDIHIHSSSPGWWLATTLLQAMSLWKYIVATPYEWAKEVIENNKNGILLDDDKIESIMDWIIDALKNIEKREQYKKINKQLFHKDFDWNQNIVKYYELFLNKR